MWLPLLSIYYKLLYYIKWHKWKLTDMRAKLNLYEEICVFFFSLFLGNDKPRTTLSSHLSSYPLTPGIIQVHLLHRDLKVYVFMNSWHKVGCLEFPKSILCYLSTWVNWGTFPPCLRLCDKGFFLQLLLCRKTVLFESQVFFIDVSQWIQCIFPGLGFNFCSPCLRQPFR